MATENPKNNFFTSDDEMRALLEKSLIDEFLRSKGFDHTGLKNLSKDEAQRIIIEASIYASGKLTEIESKSRFKQDIKDIGSSQ